MRGMTRSVVSAGLSLVLIAVCFRVLDLRQLRGTLLHIPLGTVGAALALLLINKLLSSWRYSLLLTDLGIRLPFRSAVRINSLSILAGSAFFNFFGQGVARSFLLSREQWSPALAFATTGIERVVSLALLLLMAGVGAAWLFGSMGGGDFVRGTSPVVLAVNLVAVVGAIYLIGLQRPHRRFFRVFRRREVRRAILHVGGVTLAMHGTMISAYVLLATAAAPHASLGELFAVSAVVMLAASIPVSFAGWGVRELSAAYAFGAIGLMPESGLAAAMLVGILSLLALGLVTLVSVFVDKASPSASAAGAALMRPFDFTGVIAWGAGIGIAALIGFQVTLPAGKGLLRLNLADPLALVGGLLLLFLAWRNGVWRRLWQIPHLNLTLLVGSAAMTLGFLHGWARFGITDWALFNRMLGWAVLLAYFASGALVVAVAGRDGRATVLRAYLLAMAAISVAGVSLHIVDPGAAAWASSRFAGMAGNPNAFGVQIALAVALAVAGSPWKGRGGVDAVLLGVLLAAGYFSGSRASLLAVVTMLGGALAVRQIQPSRLLRATAAALVFVVGAIVLMVYVFPDADSGVAALLPTNFASVNHLQEVTSDRWASVVGGWKMWLEHPLLGAGLGAFIREQTLATGAPLVIHNSYLWLLAEFGLLGAAALAAMPLAVLYWALRTRSRTAWMALACLTVMAVISLAHEMVYQRAFWFLLGLLAAAPRILRRERDPGRAFSAGALEGRETVAERQLEGVRPVAVALRHQPAARRDQGQAPVEPVT